MAVASALVERTTAEDVALAAYAAAVADHNQIAVSVGGVLEEDRDGHERGTVYVTLTVPTAAAAELAAERLRPIARIEDDRWAHGWRCVAGPALALDIYPDPDEGDIADFVAAHVAAQARRHPDLEELVRERLGGAAPDVEVIDSGEGDDGRRYVDIRVGSADGADRAEAALGAVAEIALPWRLEAFTLSTRVYPEVG
jgi:hypothetical protein